MADADVEAAIEQLYAAPLDEFVAERKRLARELRTSGARPAAAEVAKLAKPTAPAWALNLVARDDPDAVAQWLATADGLREASANAAEVGGDALRAAMAAHRAATGDLIAVVRERARPGGRTLSEPMVDRVRALLQAATVEPGMAERLRAGRVSEDEAAAGEPAPAAAPRAKRAGGEAAPAVAPAAAGEAAPERAAQAAERAAAERAERRAELEGRVAAAADEAERLAATAARDAEAADAAGEQLDEARRTLHRRESEAAAARDAAEEARRAAADAEQELEQLRTRLRRTGD